MGIIKKVIGSYSEREVKRIIPLVDKIDALDEKIASLNDKELKNKTEEFKERLKNGETVDDILVEAFAVLREASWRVLKKKHYRVQLIGGIVLHQGRIAEMKTGEGKTLVATLPAYLNALEGKGVHVITVNDYLAQRDRDEMSKVYGFLGLTTGVVIPQDAQDSKRNAYNCDITYGTNSEFGFDYLRDNMVNEMEEKVQRGLHYCIVDEMDSILIDEARTPLIISGGSASVNEYYKLADYFAKTLKIEEDFTIDEKSKSVLLSDEGVEKAEKFYNVENFTEVHNLHIQHYTVQALKANYSMQKEVDYIIKENKVYIVDEFTGRTMEGRRFSDGLHCAIEAKEGVPIEGDNKTFATITYQNFFRMYTKLSGMTGTAQTEEYEFKEIYALDVIVVPTNKPIKRIDNSDVVYKSEFAKFKAVVDEIERIHETNQPVLVGTVSIEKSELLSFMLKTRGIPHEVLNAKHHAKEAEIVAKAGQMGAVTIATNMAGRGTDIILGEGVRELGGLRIIGTEKHESRRIDNQLRGRSGRQGDVGESTFYVSLEDDLIKVHTSEKFKKITDKLDLEDETQVNEAWTVRAIESAQKNVEANSFDTRKNLIQYDDVINKQREVIYSQRDRVILKEDLKQQVLSMVEDVIQENVTKILVGKKNKKFIEEEVKDLIKKIKELFKIDELKEETLSEIMEMKSKDDVRSYFKNIAFSLYDAMEERFKEAFEDLQKAVILKAVDNRWIEHLENMEHLKQYIGLQAYKQQDPAMAYKLQSAGIFDDMVSGIKTDVIKGLYKY